MHHRVCMASDFFYPNVGGVEEHIFNLSQCLLENNHHVIVLTHSYDRRVGIRYMTNGLKVYYLPIKKFYCQCVLPSMICSLPLIRCILLRERITIVHGHSAFSPLAHETMMIARLMGLKSVFTDHSLFGLADVSAILINKLFEISLSDCDHCISVSHVGKENAVVRARIPPDRVSVIPNAIDTTVFTPKEDNIYRGTVNIMTISRLVYRKGIDLLAQIIVDICNKYPEVRFIVVGDGPKRALLEKVTKQHNLGSRVVFLGRLAHVEVAQVLKRGNIFLNTSLTEAFCMALVEAASCGLKVVSTKVGGIPEVLPSTLVHLSEPSVPALIAALECAIGEFTRGAGLTPKECYSVVRTLYTWHNVRARTEKVYDMVSACQNKPLKEQFRQYLPTGGYLFLLLVAFMYFMLTFLDWYVPNSSIDYSRDYKRVKNSRKRDTFCQRVQS